jgi:hypothetical protein
VKKAEIDLLALHSVDNGFASDNNYGNRDRELMLATLTAESEIKRSDFGHNTRISKHNWHALYVNSILTHANVWADKTPGAEVAAQMTDFDFKRHKRFPYKVTEGDGTKNSIAMDSLLAFKFADKDADDKQFLIELETGSQAPAALREKIKRLVLFNHNGGFQDVFETDLFSGYLFFAMGIHDRLTPDDHRKMILREIAKTLRDMSMEHYAPLFRVAAYPMEFTKIFKTKPGEEPTDPSIYFTRPLWYFPGYYDGYKLLDDLG